VQFHQEFVWGLLKLPLYYTNVVDSYTATTPHPDYDVVRHSVTVMQFYGST
jgi:hypothetical protein